MQRHEKSSTSTASVTVRAEEGLIETQRKGKVRIKVRQILGARNMNHE